MVDNVADDDVEPKPAKNESSDEGSGDVKPTVNLKPFKVEIPMQAGIGKIEKIHKMLAVQFGEIQGSFGGTKRSLNTNTEKSR